MASFRPPCGGREPHGAAGIEGSACLAIAEALRDGADVVPASNEVGRRLAENGVSLLEALDGLSALYRSMCGGEPVFAAVRALSSWRGSPAYRTGGGSPVKGVGGPSPLVVLVVREPV